MPRGSFLRGLASSSKSGTARSFRAFNGSKSSSRLPGGEPIFPELRQKRLAKDRIVHEDEALRRKPDVILASWCGKKMKKSTIVSRPGWADLPAVQRDRIYEIPSTYILQPGPAALTDGVRLIYERLASMYSE